MHTESDVTFTLVGSGAVRYNEQRGGTCQVLKLRDRLVLIDCGRCAVQNSMRFGYKLQDFDTIFISHLHFDHVCDLPHFILLSWVYGRKKPLQIYGPKGMADFLEHAVKQGFQADIESRIKHGKDTNGLIWNVTELTENGSFIQDAGLTVSALFSEHADMPNTNYRFDYQDKRVVITSDTVPDPALADFSRGADLLVVECSGTQSFLASQPWGAWHMTPETVGALVRDSAAKRTWIKHLVIESWVEDPDISTKMAATASQIADREVSVGADGMTLQL